MDEELKELISDFNKKLTAAQTARAEVMNYLETHYNIDTRKEYETMEDECDWCYGIDTDGVEILIQAAEKKKNNKNEI